jgi:hypothetical protein
LVQVIEAILNKADRDIERCTVSIRKSFEKMMEINLKENTLKYESTEDIEECLKDIKEYKKWREILSVFKGSMLNIIKENDVKIEEYSKSLQETVELMNSVKGFSSLFLVNLDKDKIGE